MMSMSNLSALPTDRPPDMKTLLGFPKTLCSLWDRSATGNSVFLHMGYYRKPKICIPEKILRLIQHQCENYSQIHHMLIGSLVIEDDGEGVQFQVDRLDTRNKIPPDGSGLAPGDLLIPLEVSNNTEKERSGSVEDYHCAIRRLQSRCCSKASVDLCEFVLLRGWGSYYSNAHSSVVHLDFDMVTMETVFKATPIPPVPILLTALSKNLAGPMSLSHMQGTTKTGYLSMDHTRKLLLVLESDPKACSLPLIGIWVSGAEFVQHPFVWASCLRYIHSTHLQDRVCLPPNEFLLVLYTPLHSRPEFYQCSPTSGSCDLQFQLRTGHEVTNMTKTLSAPCHDFTEIELDAFEGGAKMQLFDAAKAEHGLDLFRIDSGNGNMSVSEDIEPRCVPTPHMERVPSIRPMVPDVSILWAEPPHQQQPPPAIAQLSNQPPVPHNGSHAELKKYYKPQHPPRSSHFTPVNSAHQTLAPTSNIHSSVPSTVSSSQLQQYTYNHPQSGQVFVTVTNTYPRSSISGNKQTFSKISNICQQNAVGSAFIPQNIRPDWPQAPQPSGSNVSVAPQTSYNSVSSTAPALFTHPSLSCSGFQSEFYKNLGGSQQSPMGGHHISRAVNPVSPPSSMVHCQSSIATHRDVPQCISSSSNSPHLPPTWPTQTQTANSQTYSKTVPILTTVVEESSTSQSSSSSVPSSTSQMQNGLNGNILALSSLSLGFNSTKGNGSSHGNNSMGTCQSSDDDDSGLSITPDQVNSFPVQLSLLGVCQSQGARCSGATIPPVSVSPNHKVTSSSTTSAGAIETKLESRLDGVRWDEVPPAVRALLEQQSEQLKVLQQQIQMLLHNQSQQSALSASLAQQARPVDNAYPEIASNRCSYSASSTQTQGVESNGMHGQKQLLHNPTASHDKTAETCSIGVNTTILEDSNSGHNSVDSHSVQTSPVKTFEHQNFFLSPVLGDRSNNCHLNEGIPSSGTTPSELQHQSYPTSSTTYESSSMTPLRGSEGSPKLVKRDSNTVDENVEDDQVVSQKDLVSAMAGLPIQDQTINTVASELVVDMPDYASTVNDGMGLDQTCSPPSISKCYGPDQDDSYSTVAEDAMDPKQYYSQLMNNIQMFLNNDKTCEADLSEDHIKIGAALKISSPIKSGDGSSANSSMIPRINYVSMMLGSSLCGSPMRGGSPWDSDPGQSMEINAMAMKYLSDEQLTQMAMLRQMHNSNSDGQDKKTARALQMVMEKYCQAPNTPSSADISRLGISPNNMTMATQRYLEKHGLLGNGESMMMTSGRGQGSSNELSTFDHSLKLRTDFSMAQSSSGNNISNSRKDGINSLCEPVTPGKSPLRQNVINTDYAKQGSSPELKPISSKQKVPSGDSKRIKAETGQERSENVSSPLQRFPRRQAANPRQNDSVSTDDPDEENILDIARLKQMPKLL